MKARRITPLGFTLIEMLVVIAIIGILAGLILSAVSASIMKGRNVRAAADARQIAIAWESYCREYATWPSGFGGTEGSTAADATDCTNLLAGADSPAGANPRGIVFFELRNRDLKDPWGRSYRYMLDLDYNGRITTPWGEIVGRTSIAWSKGVNGDDSSASAREDDAVSWK
jgi:prepilin-type N-terminal cleavage/methylation domain-containing protein